MRRLRLRRTKFRPSNNRARIWAPLFVYPSPVPYHCVKWLIRGQELWSPRSLFPTWLRNDVWHNTLLSCQFGMMLIIISSLYAYVCAQLLSHVQLFVTPWTVACQASLSMGFSQQEYWSGLPFPPLGDLPDPGIQSRSPESPALAGWFFITEPPGNPLTCIKVFIKGQALCWAISMYYFFTPLFFKNIYLCICVYDYVES